MTSVATKPGTLRRRLRDATAEQHARLDLAVAAAGWHRSAERVATLLLAFREARAATEHLAAGAPGEALELLGSADTVLDADLVDAAAADALAHGAREVARVAPCAPGAAEAGSWAGVLYVAEGSLLGGMTLARQLDDAPWAWPGPLRFFRLGATEPGRWSRTLRLLDEVPTELHGAAERGARSSFSAAAAAVAHRLAG